MPVLVTEGVLVAEDDDVGVGELVWEEVLVAEEVGVNVGVSVDEGVGVTDEEAVADVLGEEPDDKLAVGEAVELAV